MPQLRHMGELLGGTEDQLKIVGFRKGRRRDCVIPSPSSAIVLNHISSHFLIPLLDFSFICTVPAQVTRHLGHYNRYYI